MAAGRDPIDQANAIAEFHREIALQMRKPAGPQETGACLCCEQPLPGGRRWCNALCRDQWQSEQ